MIVSRTMCHIRYKTVVHLCNVLVKYSGNNTKILHLDVEATFFRQTRYLRTDQCHLSATHPNFILGASFMFLPPSMTSYETLKLKNTN